MQSALTAIPEKKKKKKKTNELADPVLQSVDPIENNSQIFSES